MAYFLGLCKGIYPQNMALYDTVPPFQDPGDLPLIIYLDEFDHDLTVTGMMLKEMETHPDSNVAEAFSCVFTPLRA